MSGNKTHEQQVRSFERKDDVPKAREVQGRTTPAQDARRATMDPRDGVVNPSTGHVEAALESRDHNKHNRGGQQGHRPQQHSEAEEKK